MQATIHKSVKTTLSQKKIKKVVDVASLYIPKKWADSTCAVLLVGEKKMQSLNRQFRGVDRPTDVLAFPEMDKSWSGKSEELLQLGEVVLCIPYIKRQAKRFNVSFLQECTRMLAHGILHLAGYDHDTKAAAKKMFTKQEAIVKKCM